MADESDEINDSTVRWPDNRLLFEVGRFELTHVHAHDSEEQQQLIFDPMPGVDGIEPTEDPLLTIRSAVYQRSGQRRREVSSAAVMPSDNA